jgi:hypothetical protein
MAEQQGDQRIRRRVTTPGPQGKSSTGTYSMSNKNMEFCNKHYITVLIAAGSTAGVFSIRAEPAGVATPGMTGFAKIEIESVNIATATVMQFEVAGFFDAFALIIGTAISGGSAPGISVFVNSTIVG